MLLIWIAAVILVLGIGYNVFWWAVDVLHPRTYRQVAVAELHSHILSLFNRGLNGSQMLIASEQSGRRIRFHKSYRHNHQGIAFHLLVADVVPEEVEQFLTNKAVTRTSLRIRTSRGGRRLEVDCVGNVQQAYVAADVVLSELYRCPATSTFSIYVKGGIRAVNGVVRGDTTAGDIYAMCKGASEMLPRARPYKWWVGEGEPWARRLGAGLGRIVTMFLPPHNKDHL